MTASEIIPEPTSALTRAICDRSLPCPLRAGMLREINGYGASPFGNPDNPVGINISHVTHTELPLAFQDSLEGRRWYCEQRKSGYEDVRCSDLLFFEKSLGTYRKWQLEQGKVKVDPRVEDAVVNDSPAKLRIMLDLEGKSLGVRLFNIILLHRKPNMLWFLMENDNLVKEFIDRRRILFYACANLGAEAALGLVEKAEKLQLGIAATCVDALGRNLLWYTLYSDNWRDRRLTDALVGYGCDPDARTAFGLSWREMKDAKEATQNILFPNSDIFVNGVSAREAIPGYGKDCPKLDSVKVVLHDGAVMEWKWTGTGDRYFRDVTGVNEGVGFRLELNRTKKYSDSFGRAYAVFRKGPDGLYRFTGMQDA